MVSIPFRSTTSFNKLKDYVHAKNGMLVFKNEEAFKKVVTYLHDSINQLPNPWHFEIEKADYILEPFERMFSGYTSLRQVIFSKRWGLKISNRLTADNDPDDYFFPDKVIRSLVNTNLKLAIGSKVVSIQDSQNNYSTLKAGGKVENSFFIRNKFNSI